MQTSPMEKNSWTGSLHSSVLLRSKLSRHERGDRAAGRLTLEQYAVHGIDDRHLDSFTGRELARALRGDYTFRDGLLVSAERLPAFSPSRPRLPPRGCGSASPCTSARDHRGRPARRTCSARAPSATPSRVISASPRVISAARELNPSPSPSAMPVATAMTFLSAPPSSTPVTSLCV